ncbi:MAG: phosphate-starvation-inducible PsiE family protein [Burkholderiales bacterium]|jgi:protein PsiE|nr:phosphate-starvation-inducible PsiE family protein [Burkholderiales bacterium]
MGTESLTHRYARIALTIVENIGLLIIAVATVVAGYQEVMVMVTHGRVTLADLLLMFLFLEVLTMVGLYYRSGKLPVRFPLYIALIALARYIILDVKEITELRMLAVAGAILLIAVAVLIVRFGHVRYPYVEDDTRPELPGARDFGRE